MNPEAVQAALVESAWITARIAVGLSLLLAVVAVAAVHLRHPAGRAHRRQAGSWWRFAAMAAACVIGGAACAWTRGEAMRWLPAGGAGAVAALATLLALVGGMLVAWSAATLGRNFAVSAVVREGGSLVTTGPFALVRHPVYLAVGMLGLAAGLAWGSLTGSAAFLVLYAPTAWLRGRLEDALLSAAYPEAWPAWAARTPGFLPRL